MPLAGLALWGLLRSWTKDLCAFSPDLVALSTRLGKSARQAMEVADWSKDAGLRFRFAQDFSSLAHALGKGKLLLLIDDLDRCEPKQIEAVMSTLNFLFSTTAPCYSVLAMDWTYVTDALGLAFKELAVARRDTDHKGRAFAKHYLEKMIQLSIDLPAVDSSQVAFRDTSRQQKPEVVDWWQKFLEFKIAKQSQASTSDHFFLKFSQYLYALPPRWLVKFGWAPLEVGLWNIWQILKGLNTKQLNPVYHGLLVILIAYILGLGSVQVGLFIQTHLPAPLAINANSNINTQQATPNAELNTNKPPIPDTENPPKTRLPITIVDEPIDPTQPWLAAFGGLLSVILLLMIWRLSLQVQDTKVFISVMKEWQVWLKYHNDTPRDWKRLLNRARLFAMRVAVNQDNHWFSQFDKQWQALRFKNPADNTTPIILDERLAMHLMMLDVYFKGLVWRALQHIVFKDESIRTAEFKLEFKGIEYSNGMEFINAINGKSSIPANG